jgi:hypothetical protein
MEKIIPINYAPDTVLVYDNSVVFLNINGSGCSTYIGSEKVPVQKLCCLGERGKELVISKLN